MPLLNEVSSHFIFMSVSNDDDPVLTVHDYHVPQ